MEKNCLHLICLFTYKIGFQPSEHLDNSCNINNIISLLLFEKSIQKMKQKSLLKAWVHCQTGTFQHLSNRQAIKSQVTCAGQSILLSLLGITGLSFPFPNRWYSHLQQQTCQSKHYYCFPQVSTAPHFLRWPQSPLPNGNFCIQTQNGIPNIPTFFSFKTVCTMFYITCFKCSAALNSSQIFMLSGFLVVTAASESENHHLIFSNNAASTRKLEMV